MFGARSPFPTFFFDSILIIGGEECVKRSCKASKAVGLCIGDLGYDSFSVDTCS